MRTEKDFLGEKELPENALYGIHALRAKENFPDTNPFHLEWFKAMGNIKLACYQTYQKFKKEAHQHYPDQSAQLSFMEDDMIEVLKQSAEEIALGQHFEHFIIPAIQGGAGTSINMNINEIITNASLTKINKKPGEYRFIDPIDHANIFQSTNDVVPTALKVASIDLLNKLEEHINQLRIEIEKLENQSRKHLRIAYTQMQEAVPSSYGLLFSAYSESLSRDWWRVSKCFERIKVVNLGGSATGTGISVPRYFIMEVVKTLQHLTKLPVTRSENLTDTTQNLDSWVEIHGILKAHAVNLEKISSDTRLLSSDITGDKEIEIPAQQVGSSIMPGKINPVIPEYIISSAHKVYANDMLIHSLCAQGNLDLNPYLPVIGHSILESLKILINCNKTLYQKMFSGLKLNPQLAQQKLLKSPSVTTALNPHIGYQKASIIAKEMQENNIDIYTANRKLQLINEKKLEDILHPNNLLKLGFSLHDLNS